ncbi:MAG: bacillithiol biosynthesis deacetylase BshB1 [Ignavibacteria bacterium]|nr:bacillithiol biosynthesis deacetylase BshB1 [Ignavibacteria bacterium]
MSIDVLALGAHPDDIELSCGGTVAKLVKEGRTVALADLTAGELGTRGTKEIRAAEAEKAATILGVTTRRNLQIADGNIELSKENLHKVIALIRELRPRILLIPHYHERHPDHEHAHVLCKEAWFYSGLEKIKTTLDGAPQSAYRPDNYFMFMQKYEFTPTFIINVSEHFETRMQSIRAHASQFFNPKSAERETLLSKPNFLELIETRAKYYGHLIGVQYGEPFESPVSIGVGNLFDLVVAKG